MEEAQWFNRQYSKKREAKMIKIKLISLKIKSNRIIPVRRVKKPKELHNQMKIGLKMNLLNQMNQVLRLLINDKKPF